MSQNFPEFQTVRISSIAAQRLRALMVWAKPERLVFLVPVQPRILRGN